MPARPLALSCLLLLAALAPAGAAPPTPSPARPAPSTAFLPDSFVLARVQNRSIHVDRYVDAYFASYGPVRPKPDSLGRVEFLTTMVNKEVLGLTALQINRPMGFEERAVMREYTDRTLSNALYRKAVLDSVVVTDEDVRRFHAQWGFEQRYRRIGFADPTAAAETRRRIVAKALTWNAAVSRSIAFDPAHPDGDMGWVQRSALDPRTAELTWDLAPGEISQVVNAADGYFLMQLVERRKVALPSFEPMRPTLNAQLRDLRAGGRAEALQTEIGRRIGMSYDSTNIAWAANRFRGIQTVTQESQTMVLNLEGIGADLDPADTSRVLARWKDGRLTLGDFVHEYNHQTPMLRQPVGDFDAFRQQVDGMVLEPYMAEEARARGLESDPGVQNVLALKREELQVDHLFADSVQSKVYVSAADRKRYYEKHVAQFVTFPTVRFAAITRPSEAGADSVMARLKAGESAAAILHADSLKGVTSGSIKEQRDEGRGGSYHKILFGELRPGQSTIVGPDKEGTWMVLHLLAFDPGRQLRFEEVEGMVDESLQNIRAEELLKALIKRHRKRYRIEQHPELVMRIHLVDPTLKPR